MLSWLLPSVLFPLERFSLPFLLKHTLHRILCPSPAFVSICDWCRAACDWSLPAPLERSFWRVLFTVEPAPPGRVRRADAWCLVAASVNADAGAFSVLWWSGNVSMV